MIYLIIGPGTFFVHVKLGFFHDHLYKYVLWALKSMVSMRQFFCVPTAYVLV